MNDDQARQRFMVLNIVRMTAIIVVLAGIANVAGKLLPDYTPVLGYVLIGVGLIDFFVAPVILLRSWRDKSL